MSLLSHLNAKLLAFVLFPLLSSRSFVCHAQHSKGYTGQSSFPARTASFLSTDVHTQRRTFTSHEAGRWLLESTHQDNLAVWLLGIPNDRQAQVFRALKELDVVFLHMLPGVPSADAHHWLVRATGNSVRALLQAHQSVTAEILDPSLKLSHGFEDHVKALQRRSVSSGRSPETTKLHALAPRTRQQELQQMFFDSQEELTSIAQGFDQKCRVLVQVAEESVMLESCIQAIPALATCLAKLPYITYISMVLPTDTMSVASRKLNPDRRQSPSPSPCNAPDDAENQQPEHSPGVKPSPGPGPSQNPDQQAGSDAQGVETTRANGRGSGARDADSYLVTSELMPYWSAGLTGKGQVVGVIDSGLDMDSCFLWDPDFINYNATMSKQGPAKFVADNAYSQYFNGHELYSNQVSGLPGVAIFRNESHRKVVQYVSWQDKKDDIVGHGTHVTTTIIGSVYGSDPVKEPTLGTGIVPQAKVSFVDVGNRNPDSGLFVPEDFTNIFEASRQVGAHITSNSYGPVDLTYRGPDCYMLDMYANRVNDTLHIFAAGNYGRFLEFAYSTGTVASAATCKNALGVGAAENWMPDEIKADEPFNLTVNGSLKHAKDFTWSDMTRYGNMNFQDSQGTLTFLKLSGRKDDFSLAYGYNSSFQGLFNTSLKVVGWDAGSDCTLKGARAAIKAAGNTGPFMLYARTSLDYSDCMLKDVLLYAWQTNATAVLMSEESTSGGVKSYPVLANRTIPAATISVDNSRTIWFLISNNISINVTIVKDDYAMAEPRDNVAWFSSFGSLAPIVQNTFNYPLIQPDVRIKPEIVAPGYIVAASSDGNYTAEMDQCAVVWYEGTSMSTPVTAGYATIIRQYFTDGYYPTGAANASNSHAPSAPLLKAMLIAGAQAMKGVSVTDGQNLTAPPTSIFQGFGRASIPDTLPLAHRHEGNDHQHHRPSTTTTKDRSRDYDTRFTNNLQVIDHAWFAEDGVSHGYVVYVPSHVDPHDRHHGVSGEANGTTVHASFTPERMSSSMNVNASKVVDVPAGNSTRVGNSTNVGFHLKQSVLERMHGKLQASIAKVMRSLPLNGPRSATAKPSTLLQHHHPELPALQPRSWQRPTGLDTRSSTSSSSVSSQFGYGGVNRGAFGRALHEDGDRHSNSRSDAADDEEEGTSMETSRTTSTSAAGLEGNSTKEPAHNTSLTLALVWHDVPAFPNARWVLVNNLDLVVYGPLTEKGKEMNNTQLYWGNDRPGGDFQNNAEKVVINNPAPGYYFISVKSVYLFMGARPQSYSLVALGNFQGTLRSPYNPMYKTNGTQNLSQAS